MLEPSPEGAAARRVFLNFVSGLVLHCRIPAPSDAISSSEGCVLTPLILIESLGLTLSFADNVQVRASSASMFEATSILRYVGGLAGSGGACPARSNRAGTLSGPGLLRSPSAHGSTPVL